MVMEKQKILKTVANNLASLMNQGGFSNVTLANKCKISTGTISKIINGQMSITIPMAMTLAEGLGVDIGDILNGLTDKQIKHNALKPAGFDKTEQLSIGVMSINNKRISCVKDYTGKIIGSSELEGGLDLTDTAPALINLIQESIDSALSNNISDANKLKYAKLNLVTQSYEFEDTRHKFEQFAKRYFKDVILLPDWQITYLVDFEKNKGISLVTDKGVSLSYLHDKALKKIGGWKYPVYDLGGENWLGVETIHHTIRAVEGYIPMSKLAHNVLSKFGGKIEKITEICFKGARDPDIYCSFYEVLLRSYLMKDKAAIDIIKKGFKSVYESVERADAILGKKYQIALNGSLAEIYKPFFEKNRLITPSSDAKKVSLLADITKEFLVDHGVIIS